MGIIQKGKTTESKSRRKKMHLKYKTNHVIKYWNATGSTERTTIESMALSFKKKILLTLYSRRKIYNIKL